ncbi:MAG: AAA family ATPase, partial [Pseudomonadota bacterium]|nr:AAA family ATPase [Pseudomonadota bacterium]
MSADDPYTPPWSSEAEQAVLGAVLFDNRAWDRIADVLVETDFYSRTHRDAFAAIGRLIASGHPADVVTVNDELAHQGTSSTGCDLAYLNALTQSVPSAANAGRYAEVVRKHAVRRSLIAVLDEAMQAAREQSDLGGAIDEITSKLGQLQVVRGTRAPRSIAEIAVERIDHHSNVQQGLVVAGWATHLPWLNSALNGGLQAGGLYILAARPSKGKSSLVESLALNFAESGLPTLFLSMEMPESQVADRGIASTGGVSLSAMLSGQMTDEHWSRAAAAIDKLARLPLFLDDQPALTLRAIRMKAKSIRGLKVLVVDYLQLCASTRRDGNRNGEIEEISRGLKALAKELSIAV